MGCRPTWFWDIVDEIVCDNHLFVGNDDLLYEVIDDGALYLYIGHVVKDELFDKRLDFFEG